MIFRIKTQIPSINLCQTPVNSFFIPLKHYITKRNITIVKVMFLFCTIFTYKELAFNVTTQFNRYAFCALLRIFLLLSMLAKTTQHRSKILEKN